MKETIQHEKYGEILYDENFWTGRKELSINGVQLKRISRKEFQMDNGTKATVKGSFLFGAKLAVENDTIQLTPTIKWYEITLCILPFLLVMIWGNVPALCEIIPVVGGAIGGFISALLSFVGLFFMRSVKPIWAKLLIALATLAVTFGICCGIGIAIVALFSQLL